MRRSAHEECVQLVAFWITEVAGIEAFTARARCALILRAEFERLRVEGVPLLAALVESATMTPLPTVAFSPSKGLMIETIGFSGELPHAMNDSSAIARIVA